MALFAVTTGKVTLTASATKSLVLVNPAVNPAKIRQFDISLDSSAAAAGVQFDLYYVSSLGSAAGTTATPAAVDRGNSYTAQTTALSALSTEPTTVVVVASWYLQPLGGFLAYPFPYGAEPVMAPAGARWGIRYVTPASVTPDCLVNLFFEE